MDILHETYDDGVGNRLQYIKRGAGTGYNGARVYSDASIARGITQKTFSLGAKIVTGGQNVAYAYPNQICTAGSASPIGGGQNQRSLL